MPFSREQMAQIAAAEIDDGQVVNLGIGMPTLVANYLSDKPVMIHSENGLLGMGPFPRKSEVDPQIINAGKQTVTIKKGGSTFDSNLSFAMIRGGHVDVAILGAMQVAQNGDLANWSVPGKKVTGMGGAMDLVSGSKRVICMMTFFDKFDQAKLLSKCTLPLTGLACVDRVITDLGVFDIVEEGFLVVRLAPKVSLSALKDRTSAHLFKHSDVKQVV